MKSETTPHGSSKKPTPERSGSEKPAAGKAAAPKSETGGKRVETEAKQKAATARSAAATEQTRNAEVDPRDGKSRFRIFVIDSGWNQPAGKVLRENIDLIHALTHEDPIYVLGREKSVALLRKNKSLIGHDPIISVHDVSPCDERDRNKARGFRLHLGLQDSEESCLSALKTFARFINTHRDAKDLEGDVRRKLHKQGLEGAIEIVGGAATSALMEA